MEEKGSNVERREKATSASGKDIQTAKQGG